MTNPVTDDISLPVLLRAARRVYGAAIRRDLEREGYAGIPVNGIFVLAAVARAGAPLAAIIGHLGVSKQAGGQLVDALVARGYLDREVDAEDRRRLRVMLTERGRAAARITRAAIARIDARLAHHASAEAIAQTRMTLQALIEVGNGD